MTYIKIHRIYKKLCPKSCNPFIIFNVYKISGSNYFCDFDKFIALIHRTCRNCNNSIVVNVWLG